MGNLQSELDYETQRLFKTIALAKNKLNQARQRNNGNRAAIANVKKELRENTSHYISGLWGSEGFEALAELSQYVNPLSDKIAEYDTVENKILILENLIKSPYFARIDFKFEDEETPEKIYIGRFSLSKNDSADMCVYDWRSPIAGVFYRFASGPAYYDAPIGRIYGEITLKRQYEINNGLLEYFFDSDIQIADEFLRKLLSQNTSAKMKSIVETIQKEQDIVIRNLDSDLIMVQGSAGSGKTSVALHRAAYLMYQGLSDNLLSSNIIIISPSPVFERYISNVLPELGEENVISEVFDGILSNILKTERIQPKDKFLETLISNSNSRDIIKKSMEFKMSPLFTEILDRFIDDLPIRWIDFEDIYYNGNLIVSKDTLKNKILSGRKSTPLGLRLEQLSDFILESAKLSSKQFDKFKILKIKAEIQRFIRLDVRRLYSCLFSDSNYFMSLSENLELPDNIGDIINYTCENLSSAALYYDDTAANAYLTLKLYGEKKYRNIKQVVIDEAQDYYPLHYEIFNLLFPNAKFTILGDINQTLEKQEDLGLYEQIKKILNKKRPALVIMDKSFRCTKEILNYSLKFLGKTEDFSGFSRHGEKPEIHIGFDHTSFINMIVSEIRTCTQAGYKSIGLICKTEKAASSLFESLNECIDIKLIKNGCSLDLEGIFIMPVYMSKGLEFDAVLVCGADSINFYTEDDKKLLYIACTRALHRLNLFCEGEASHLL